MDILLRETIGSVAIVRLNRPSAFNALSNDLRDAIETAFNQIAGDEAVRAVVLTGTAPHFCAGYDLEEVIATGLASFGHRVLEYHAAVYFCPKPVVAAVQGFAVAGGFDLALGADLIVAAEKSMFGHPEIKFGAPPLVTSLARKIGPARALDLILRGDMISAKKGFEIGFVNEVATVEKYFDRAVALARKLGERDPAAVALTKRMANSLFGDTRANLKAEFDAFAQTNPAELLPRIQAYYKSL